MTIVIATDAWHPQVNGVVRTLSTTVEALRDRGHEVLVLSPDQHSTLPCPTYPEIRLALFARKRLWRQLDAAAPRAVHIATEGPIGWAVRGWCRRRGFPFTTSFHTRFPDYVTARTGLPLSWSWAVIRAFHAPAARTFAATASLARELGERGIGPTHRWARGVDLDLFGPHHAPHPALGDLPRPVHLSVGRVALEKNLAAFLDLDLPGSKVVVGDGPLLGQLRERYPEAIFLGPLYGEELARAYAGADLFVFPSRTDTFGLVNIEALASGLPVASFPVPGPADILGPDDRGTHGGSAPIGATDENLAAAIERARMAKPDACLAEARHYCWSHCTDRFLGGLEVVDRATTKAA